MDIPTLEEEIVHLHTHASGSAYRVLFHDGAAKDGVRKNNNPAPTLTSMQLQHTPELERNPGNPSQEIHNPWFKSNQLSLVMVLFRFSLPYRVDNTPSNKETRVSFVWTE